MTLDLFSPWREGHGALDERHVGRVQQLEAIRAGARAFARGSQPLPIYLFGARGMGKSHLLTLAIRPVETVTPAQDVSITVVPDDCVALRSPDQLFDVMMHGVMPPPWFTRYRKAQAAKGLGRSSPGGARVVLFEGLDRQLRALGKQGRRELRRLIGDGPPMWVIGAGLTLPDELTAADEAFFSAFDPWPLDPLDDDDAGELLDHAADESPHSARWRNVRSTLIGLAGGNPRALAAFGRSRRKGREPSASAILGRVVDGLTPLHRNLLCDLSPQAQQIVTALAEASHELAPSDLAVRLESSTTQMSVQARRLTDDGILRHRSDGRQTWYRLADSLFRYWLEYRHARWGETRCAWAAHAIQAIDSASSPAPAQDRTTSDDATLHGGWRQFWDGLLAQIDRALPNASQPGIALQIARAKALPPHLPSRRRLVHFCLWHNIAQHLDDDFSSWLASMPDLAALARLDGALRLQSESPRAAFQSFLAQSSLAEGAARNASSVPLLQRVLGRSAHGRAWSFSRSERSRLANVEHVRALFLRQGRWWNDAPLLTPKDVVAHVAESAPDAPQLLASATMLRHTELVRVACRSMMRSGKPANQPLPRCPALWVVDDETGALLAGVVEAAARTQAGRSQALGWIASLAEAPAPMFTKVLEALRDTPPGDDDYLHELALARLFDHAPNRFEEARALLSPHHEPEFAQAARLLSQLEGARGNFHPELHRLASALGRGSSNGSVAGPGARVHGAIDPTGEGVAL